MIATSAYNGNDYTTTVPDRLFHVNFAVSGFRKCAVTRIAGLTFPAKNLNQEIYQYLKTNHMVPLGNEFDINHIVSKITGDTAEVTITNYYDSQGQ